MHEPSYGERRRDELLLRLDRLKLELVILRTGLFAAIEDEVSWSDAASYAAQLSVAADDLCGVLQALDLMPREREFRVVE